MRTTVGNKVNFVFKIFKATIFCNINKATKDKTFYLEHLGISVQGVRENCKPFALCVNIMCFCFKTQCSQFN